MKISKTQLVRIIKEEAANFKKEIKLKKELAQIQRQLNEVHAGEEMNDSKNGGVHAGQKKANFEKKGTHLIEIEDEMGSDNESVMDALKTIAKACGLTGTIELDDEIEMGDEEGGEEVDVDVVMPDEEEIDIEAGDEDEDEDEDEGEDEGEGEEDESEEEEETVEMEEGTQEEEVKEESTKEEGTHEEGDKMMNESINMERKRMIELAGIRK